MKKISLIAITGLFTVSAASVGYAQNSPPSEEDCSQAQANLGIATEMFRSAYFQRRDMIGSAESVLADHVLPSAELVYQSCPSEIVAEIRNGVGRLNASLYYPLRAELVDCDRALITYQGLLRSYDRQILSGYSAYRSLLYSDIDPAADKAVDACPQMPDLAQQARVEILERQRRLDRMEDMENFGNTMADDIAIRNIEFTEAFESDEED